MINSLFFWVVLLLVFYIAHTFAARVAAARLGAAEGKAPPAVPPDALAALESRLAPMLAITGRKGLFLLIITPVPHALFEAIGIHSPYL